MVIKMRTVILVLFFFYISVLEIALRAPMGKASDWLDFQVILKYSAYSLAFLGFLIFFPRIRTTRIFLLPLAYSVFGFLSCLYSADPIVSASQIYVLFSQMALALTVVSVSNDLEEKALIWKVFLAAIATKIAISFLGVLTGFDIYFFQAVRSVGSSVSGPLRFGGIFGTPNAMGFSAAFGTLLCFIFFRESSTRTQKRFFFGLGAIIFVTLLMTQSRTALLGLLIASLGVVFIRNRSKAVILAFVLIAGASVFWSANRELALEVTARGQTETQLTTLQGRTLIWKLVWRLIKQAPWFGHGYASSRVVIPQNWDLSGVQEVTQSHNMFMESMLTLGLVGTALLLFLLIAVSVKYFRILFLNRPGSRAEVYQIGWGVILLAVIGGVSEPSLANAQSTISTAFLLAFAIVAVPEAGEENRLAEPSFVPPQSESSVAEQGSKQVFS